MPRGDRLCPRGTAHFPGATGSETMSVVQFTARLGRTNSARPIDGRSFTLVVRNQPLSRIRHRNWVTVSLMSGSLMMVLSMTC